MRKITILASTAGFLVVLVSVLLVHFGRGSRNGTGASDGDTTHAGAYGRKESPSNDVSGTGHEYVNFAERGSLGGAPGYATGRVTSAREARFARDGFSTAGEDTSTNALSMPLTPTVLKQRAMKQLFSAATRGSTHAMWEALREAGVTLSYEDYLQYLKTAKLRGTPLDRVEGAWDQFLQFWAGRDPGAALAWAQAHQLHAGYSGPDEIFYRMVTAWGIQDPASAAAYAQSMAGFTSTARGQDVLNFLNNMTNRATRLDLLTAPLSSLTPEQQRELAMATMSLYALPDNKVAETATWLIANRATIDSATWTRAMGVLASRMNGVPAFDLVSLLQSLPSTPDAQSLRAGVLSSLAATDPRQAMALAGDRDAERIAVLNRWSQENPAEALKWVLHTGDAKTSSPYLATVLRNMDRLMAYPPLEGIELPDPSTILQAVERMRDGRPDDYSRACEWAARAMLPVDVNKAFELAARSTSPKAMENLLTEWSRMDPSATLAWVNARNDAATYAIAVQSVLPQIARRDLDSAISWSRQLQDRNLWLQTVTDLLPLTPYERWNEVLGGSQAPLREPDIATAAISGAVRLGFNDFEGSVIAVDEIMRRMGLGETESDRKTNWARQPESVTTAFMNSQQDLLSHLSYHDPQGALAWAEQWPWLYADGSQALSPLRFAYSRWQADGSGRAQDWLSASRFTDAQREAIRTQVATPLSAFGTNRMFRVTTPMRGP